MVSYQKFVGLVFEQVPDETLSDPGEAANVMKVAANIWNDRKETLSSATVGEARRIASSEITIKA